MDAPRTFHLHMISDATGETLVVVAKAVRVQYSQARAIEHIHPLVRSKRELERVLKDVEANPGMVLYTIVNQELAEQLEQTCKRLNVPCVPVLKSILQVFESYLGTPSIPTVAGQHVLDADYFRRIEALNFTMLHDDGHLPENLDDADILLIGISRTSKTPTSIYLANRGYKVANVPLVPESPPPAGLFALSHPMVVGLTTNIERLIQIRRNRLISLNQAPETDYVDNDAVNAELAFARRMFADNGWPVIDVTRRSIEEAAVAIVKLATDRNEAAAQ